MKRRYVERSLRTWELFRRLVIRRAPLGSCIERDPAGKVGLSRRALAGSSYPKERIGVVPIQSRHQGIKYRGGLQRTWGGRGERGMPGAGLRNGGRRWLPQHISAMPVRADSACMGAFDSVSVCVCRQTGMSAFESVSVCLCGLACMYARVQARAKA